MIPHRTRSLHETSHKGELYESLGPFRTSVENEMYDVVKLHIWMEMTRKTARGKQIIPSKIKYARSRCVRTELFELNKKKKMDGEKVLGLHCPSVAIVQEARVAAVVPVT